MKPIFRRILECKEAAALPGMRESGGLPALISGLSAVHRANLAAAIQDALQENIVVICPDDSTAESFAADLRSMLETEPLLLGMREFDLHHAEAFSHQEEQKRIASLYALATEPPKVCVCSVQGLIQRTSPKEELLKRAFTLEVSGTCPPEDVMDALVRCGYARAYEIEGRGQFAQRGGILDFFSPAMDDPVRIEFWGDDIDSMASFELMTQRRTEELDHCLILPAIEETGKDFSCALDYIPEDCVVFLDQAGRCFDRAREYAKSLDKDMSLTENELAQRLCDWPLYMTDAFLTGRNPITPKSLASVQAKQLPTYAGNAQTAAEDARSLLDAGYRVTILAGDERRRDVLRNFLESREIFCDLQIGSVSAGMEYPSIKTAILTDAQLIRQRERVRAKRKASKNRQRITSCSDLSVGDYVVHENHGIGRFTGVVRMEVDGFEKDYIKIAYSGSDVLYVPATQLDMVSKYTGSSDDVKVKLSKLGGTDWQSRKTRAKGAAKEMAGKLIRLYASRLQTEGYAFSPDSEWQKEFEENFAYTETDDQLRCIAEIKKDMESSTPMDRLLCGDVGFGKTEVALRAVMKCVLDGKQAAILAPTTVLARQHYQTALQRFFGFPVNIALVSRYNNVTAKTLSDISSGKCDLVIGTHRILSKDVKFRNLGLLVVDEEQRFGVSHKEHIKELSRGVDVLTLSATPIPRTMNMAMSGIRDMSLIEEPPQDRVPVQTFVIEHDWNIVADAIRRELARGGQVYYLHNRIEDIERCANRLQSLLGEVNIEVAHGKMDKNALGEIMDRMVAGDVQVLVCTTIIETGIDIPNVNTLIIEDADRLGLAQLHQIRGRVGRSTRRANAYLTFRRDKVLTEDAEKRLNAIRDFAEFNSGMKIALRDLEIRGAGNLLGAEQSGHMSDVGYDMYMKLLNEAVLEARGIEIPQKADCSADLAVSANIPERYIASAETRMDIYRKIALIRTEEEAEDLLDELIDRFGDPPPGVNALIQVALLRGEAGKADISDISQKHGMLRFTVEDFDMQKVSNLYARPEYKGRLKVEAGSRPCLSLKIKNKARVIDEARKFVYDWSLENSKIQET